MERNNTRHNSLIKNNTNSLEKTVAFTILAETALQQAGILLTPKKKLIVDELAATKGSFKIEALYLKMRNQNMDVCRSTVHNLIALLLRSGLITVVEERPRKPKLLKMALIGAKTISSQFAPVE
ncbi:MAG: hypothetical protein ACOYXT_24350 [Bacteroidota bacterium]